MIKNSNLLQHSTPNFPAEREKIEDPQNQKNDKKKKEQKWIN